MDEDQVGPDPGESHVALAGPNPKPTHNEFMAIMYPKVHESLKFLADEHVILQDLLSSTGTLSLMKNLDDAFTIGDQFINDKATEEEPEKLNVESEVVSMKSKNLDNMTKNLRSRVFILELRDLPHKIDETIADRKEMLHQRMFEIRSYKSLPEQVAFYEALEASMERAQRDKFLVERDKSQKRRLDDQDPPSPPPKDSDQRKKKRHDSDSLGSKQSPAPQGHWFCTSPKIKLMPEWLKPIPEEDRPESPRLDWPVPPNDLPKPENN
ncbi:hypothetical protein Tco_0580377 [Tanacetum coccineum]